MKNTVFTLIALLFIALYSCNNSSNNEPKGYASYYTDTLQTDTGDVVMTIHLATGDFIKNELADSINLLLINQMLDTPNNVKWTDNSNEYFDGDSIIIHYTDTDTIIEIKRAK